MGMHVWVTGLALGLVGFVLSAGCSQQDPGEQASSVVEREAHERAEAAQTGAPAPAVAAADPPGRELSAAVQDTATLSEDAVDDAKISIKRAGQAERDAYEKARAKAKSQFDASGTADR